MPIRRYLAMTEGEFRRGVSPPYPAYLACCFAPFGPGITPPPRTLPRGCALILTDRIEPSFHDPELAARQIHTFARQLQARAIVLDLQRPGHELNRATVRAVSTRAPCSVVVSAAYGDAADAPVLVSVPAGIALEDALQPWAGRPVWLEMGMSGAQLELTGQGCRRKEAAGILPCPGDPEDKDLCCRYRTAVEADKATFYLYETLETWEEKLLLAEKLGIENAIGLYQEFGPLQRGADR